MDRTQWTGFLSMDIENRAGKSVPKNIYFHDALKVQRPVYDGKSGRPCYYILNLGGGYLDGDTYRIEIKVREKAELTLTTLGATLIYKTPTKPVYQETEIFLEENSYLEYLPDPIIGYEKARYKQLDTIYMKKGATLFYSDILTPGWSAEGRSFSYDMLHLRTNIYMEDELVVYDNIKLEPAVQQIDVLGFMEEYTHLGTFIVIAEKIDEDLVKRLQEVINKQSGDFKAGISSLTVAGFTLRVMANMTQDIQKVISACHALISKEWYAKTPPLLRKY
ncbi:urease accessory protein UreD [Marixanthomonas spongiae]|uniref:Urease accessory protein UreD n=1 Tax=Marixanthomonas spongiae TaxID=2174845 RepID=A0A2U0I0W4_9FLAO|nr:urease accessory protein UreD [Marixanthomonas spongiae]PVW14640.1 urease accessory protein [Marixanthomonas spongiae]